MSKKRFFQKSQKILHLAGLNLWIEFCHLCLVPINVAGKIAKKFTNKLPKQYQTTYLILNTDLLLWHSMTLLVSAVGSVSAPVGPNLPSLTPPRSRSPTSPRLTRRQISRKRARDREATRSLSLLKNYAKQKVEAAVTKQPAGLGSLWSGSALVVNLTVVSGRPNYFRVLPSV